MPPSPLKSSKNRLLIASHSFSSTSRTSWKTVSMPPRFSAIQSAISQKLPIVADRRLAIFANEVVVLLVAQRLEGRCVDHLGAGPQSAKDRVLGDHCLAARGWGGDEHASPTAVQLVDRLPLETVQLERQARLKLFHQRVGGFHSLISSVDTPVMRAPSLWASTYARTAAKTSSACRPLALTVATASSASCQRSSSPTSAAATWCSCRNLLRSPLTTWRLDLSEPLSGRWSTTLSRPTVKDEDIHRLDYGAWRPEHLSCRSLGASWSERPT